MSRRVLVTGGAGLIGVGLVERLMSEGHRVVVLDNLFRGERAHLSAFEQHANFRFVEGDVLNEADLQRCAEAFEGLDVIHHLAAVNGTKWFHEAARQVIDTNVNGTLRTLSLAERHGARYVLASSPEAFGDATTMPIGEHEISRFPPAGEHQRFSYGASKYLDEVAVHHAVRSGLDGRIVRPFNAYGHRMVSDAYGQVIGMMFGAVRRQEPMQVHGNGQQTRSFTHLDDIVDGFYLAGEMDVDLAGEPLAGATFNLGSEEEVTVLELAQAVNRTVGSQAVDVVLGGGYFGDSKRRLPDVSAARERLGWACSTTLEQGLALMWRRLQSVP